MSGSKNWQISRTQVARDPLTGRLHNPDKFAELGNIIDGASDKYNSSYKELANRMARKILEETANIVQHNKTWNDLTLKTDINSTRTTFKYQIKYDGGQYYNPSNLAHVVDASQKFAAYERESSVAQDGTVIIKIKISFRKGDE